jgi:sugar lactone lactonase YvrE
VRPRAVTSWARLVNARVAADHSIRVASLLAIGTLVAAACTASRDKSSSEEPTAVPTTSPTTGTAPSVCSPGSGIITTVAGSWPYEGAYDQGFPDWRSWGDGGPATQAQLDLPSDVAVDASGNLYILETSHGPGLVRKVDPSGRITTVVGPATDGAPPAPGEASRVDLLAPFGITLDAEGNLYVGGGNGGNSMVVKVDRSGEVTTVAGTGKPGFSGDGGPATEAQLNVVTDLALDRAGNLYIADDQNNRIRKVSPDGVITTFAGTGKLAFSGDGGPAVKAGINDPTGIAVDTAGNVYVAELGNDRIRRVDRSGIIETVAGRGRKAVLGDGGQATKAGLHDPLRVVVDAKGDLFFSEGDRRSLIRKVDRSGVITTIAGKQGTRHFSGDGGPATEATFDEPNGVTLGPDGDLYIAEFESARVRRVCL